MNRRLIACIAIIAIFAALIIGAFLYVPTSSQERTPLETQSACYTESFGAGTVPTSKEIPCP